LALRVLSCGRVRATLLFSAVLLLPLIAEAGLPRVAITIPTDQNLAVGLKAAEQCNVPGKLIVLPPLAFDFAGDESSASVFEEQAQALQGMPEGSEVWLDVAVNADSLAGNESDKQITEKVNAFLKPMLLSASAVRGMIVEIEGQEPLRAHDRFAFELARLALIAKASKAALRVAFIFPPGFVGHHGDIVKRLATYSDLLGTTYAEGWRQDVAWIAEQALNKPVILKLSALKVDVGASATPSPFLKAMLATGGTPVEIVWAEPPDAKAAADLCTASSFLSRSITSNMFATDSAVSPFSVAVDGVGNSEHRWFSGGSGDVVIVARVNASPHSPKAVRLQSVKLGPFEIKWYDPATGAELPAG